MENKESNQNGRSNTPPSGKKPKKRPGDPQGESLLMLIRASATPLSVPKKHKIKTENNDATASAAGGAAKEGPSLLSFHAKYACLARRLQDDLGEVFQEHFCQLFQLQQEQDSAFERVGELLAKAQAVNAELELQIIRTIDKIKNILDSFCKLFEK